MFTHGAHAYVKINVLLVVLLTCRFQLGSFCIRNILIGTTGQFSSPEELTEVNILKNCVIEWFLFSHTDISFPHTMQIIGKIKASWCCIHHILQILMRKLTFSLHTRPQTQMYLCLSPRCSCSLNPSKTRCLSWELLRLLLITWRKTFAGFRGT